MPTHPFDRWPSHINADDFPIYQPRKMAFIGHWSDQDWALKVYAIQSKTQDDSSGSLIRQPLLEAAQAHVLRSLTLTHEEGAFYKTGFVVLHEGAQANWLLFQWWTHDDVWCQLLAYAPTDDPLNFRHSTRPIRACVYETAIIWYEQKSWINNILSGKPNRRAYLEDAMPDTQC